MARQSIYGAPLRAPPPSRETILVLEPTLGLDVATAAMNLKPGATPSSDNYIMREGALEPRPMLTPSANSMPFVGVPVLGGYEVTDVLATRYPLASTTTVLAFRTGFANWSRLSYVPAYGLNDPPSGTTVQYWDITQIYDPIANENVAAG